MNPEVLNKLEDYISKRDFEITPEPHIGLDQSIGNRFCIQYHDASNLHYDLRLEKNGVLMSWAIPKGLPAFPEEKRLAIKTEDHPLKYLKFEGHIPKGQYGAGDIWVWTSGTYSIIEESDTKIKFSVKSQKFNRTYSLFQTKEEQWMIVLLENHDFSKIQIPIAPMLASSSQKIPKGLQFKYEVKWDGIRALFYLRNNELTIFSRSGRDITKQFPELTDPDYFEVESGIFDGEIVCLDDQGKPVFADVISRMHSRDSNTIESRKKKTPVYCYLFD